ncbi:hypothetical protein MRB53_041834 [Persea americana]|nr:hypothetical protein MRB53_041834 [Persea americana]
MITLAAPLARKDMVNGSLTVSRTPGAFAGDETSTALSTVPESTPPLTDIVEASSAYGEVHASPCVEARSAYARFRVQKPDCAQVLKFSCLTETARGSVNRTRLSICSHVRHWATSKENSMNSFAVVTRE